jgi:hypothetical protein
VLLLVSTQLFWAVLMVYPVGQLVQIVAWVTELTAQLRQDPGQALQVPAAWLSSAPGKQLVQVLGYPTAQYWHVGLQAAQLETPVMPVFVLM